MVRTLFTFEWKDARFCDWLLLLTITLSVSAEILLNHYHITESLLYWRLMVLKLKIIEQSKCSDLGIMLRYRTTPFYPFSCMEQSVTFLLPRLQSCYILMCRNCVFSKCHIFKSRNIKSRKCEQSNLIFPQKEEGPNSSNIPLHCPLWLQIPLKPGGHNLKRCVTHLSSNSISMCVVTHQWVVTQFLD